MKSKPLNFEVVKVNVPVKHYKKLRDMAEKADVSIQSIINQAIAHWLGE